MVDRNRPEDAPLRPATAKRKLKSEIVEVRAENLELQIEAAALAEELRRQWQQAHDQTCNSLMCHQWNPMGNGRCTWPKPKILEESRCDLRLLRLEESR